ncbi:family 16 glycosylhydrolase [Altererythrobacter salegens]|uniref:Family 16 glycosylhydrolase n=1 Tax=Croceibacterium salegens TaxID=1737568 RepID=A0A6I4ST40_9SPHN|nr:glycoside hydrolase family 16 protein [Croceibacterium salegens]MXO58177.1 family 16 glycosylhydrolase [Croceibacterium salegens]
MNSTRTLFALAATAALTLAFPARAEDPPGKLVFAEEFDGQALDRTRWNVVGPDFWVNNEQQAYVDDPATVSIVQGVSGAKGGALMLRPLYKPGIDPKGDRKADFVSGRIDTQGKFEFSHGRAEARIRMPDAEGVWPAFWLLGNGKWPDSGEIDIMEYVGEKDWTGVALHGPGYSGETPLVNKFYFPEGLDVTDWHTYSVEWDEQAILFEVDDHLVYRVTRPMVEHYGKWRFDNPKYVILNFALGGAYPFKINGVEKPYNGLPAATVEKIKGGNVAMLVDWVRVWSADEK